MTTVKQASRNTSNSVLANKTTQLTAGVVIVALIGFGTYFGLTWRNSQKQQEAQRAFMDSFDSYKKATQLTYDERASEHGEELWDQVDQDFKAANDQFGGTTLSPYYTMFRAQAMVAKGQLKEGLALMSDVIKAVGNNPSYKYLYETTKALIQLDSTATQSEGLNSLVKLSEEKANPIRDMAYYYLGEYYTSTNEKEKAQQAWKAGSALEKKGGASYELPSPWAAYSTMKVTK